MCNFSTDSLRRDAALSFTPRKSIVIISTRSRQIGRVAFMVRRLSMDHVPVDRLLLAGRRCSISARMGTLKRPNRSSIRLATSSGICAQSREFSFLARRPHRSSRSARNTLTFSFCRMHCAHWDGIWIHSNFPQGLWISKW